MKAKDAVPGQWYECDKGKRLFCTHGGEEGLAPLFIGRDGVTAHIREKDLKQLPDCDGWDWKPTQPLQLRVGGKYRSRSGEVVKLIRTHESNEYPFVGDNSYTYTPCGIHHLNRKGSGADLIEEIDDVKPPHPPVPDGWEIVEGNVIKPGERYCVPGVNSEWSKEQDSEYEFYSPVIIIRRIEKPTPDPGPGWRIASGEDWRDERCERWSTDTSEWVPRIISGHRFNTRVIYRIPDHPPIPDGWEKVYGEMRAGDKYCMPGDDCWIGAPLNITKYTGKAVVIRRAEPTYRPFASADEAGPLFDERLRRKDNGAMFRIVGMGDQGVMAGLYSYTYQEAFEQYERMNGSPFGIEVTND